MRLILRRYHGVYWTPTKFKITISVNLFEKKKKDFLSDLSFDSPCVFALFNLPTVRFFALFMRLNKRAVIEKCS